MKGNLRWQAWDTSGHAQGGQHCSNFPRNHFSGSGCHCVFFPAATVVRWGEKHQGEHHVDLLLVLVAMASKLIAMASTLVAMASNLIASCYYYNINTHYKLITSTKLPRICQNAFTSFCISSPIFDLNQPSDAFRVPVGPRPNGGKPPFGWVIGVLRGSRAAVGGHRGPGRTGAVFRCGRTGPLGS